MKKANTVLSTNNSIKYDVFISYCHSDAERDNHIFDIVSQLKKNKLRVWMDTDLKAAEIFSDKIAEAIAKSARVLWFVGSDAPKSEYVASEIKYARIQGCKIFPVLYALKPEDEKGRFDFLPERYRKLQVPDFSEEGKAQGKSYSEQVETLIEALKEPIIRGNLSSRFRGIPSGYEPRYYYFDRMESALFGNLNGVKTDYIGGFCGRPGTGKSIMANLFCRDAEIRSRFPDGIVWIDVNETGGWATVLNQLREDFAQQIKDCFEEEDIKREIGNFFKEKNMLVVLDDVWSHSSNILDGFVRILSEENNCKLLVTSRDKGIISAYTGAVVEIEGLSHEEAERMMLKAEPGGIPATTLDTDAAKILDECECHTLSVAIVCAMRRGGREWETIRQDIQRHLTQISSNMRNYPFPSAYAAIAASVEALSDVSRNYYRQLTVLPKGSSIKLKAAAVLWGMSEDDARDVALGLYNKSLISYDDRTGTLHLHDLEYDYLSIAVKEIDGLHKEFVAAYRNKVGGDWLNGPDDGYYYQHIIYHMLKNSDSLDTAGELLSNYAWIKKVLEICGCASILRDYRNAETRLKSSEHYALVHAIGRCVYLSAQALTTDCKQLPMHLVGRLKDLPEFEAFLDSIYRQETDFWLNPTARCMLPPNSNLSNQWNIGAGASCIANQGGRFVVSSRGTNSNIYLFDIEANESLFMWETKATISAVVLNGDSVITADSDGNVDCWTVGSPNACRVTSFNDKIIFMDKLSNGELIYATASGIVSWQNVAVSLKYDATVTAYCLYKDVLNVGYEDGYFIRLDLARNEKTIDCMACQGMPIVSIAACDAYVAIKAILPATHTDKSDNTEWTDVDDEHPESVKTDCAIVAVLEDFYFGPFRELFRLSTPAGGLHVMRHDADRRDLLLYTDGIFVNAYDVANGQKLGDVAINEHWVIKSVCIDKNILCVDNYGHVCCFDTTQSFVSSFNAYDSFTMRTMVNKESFGSLEIGIRGVSVDITDSIVSPEYRTKIGIRPVVFCMAKTPDGIVYGDGEHGVCFIHVGSKEAIIAEPRLSSRPLYALAYRGQPVVGFADGTVMIYTVGEKTCEGRVYCHLPSAVNVMCTDDEYLYCSSRDTVYKMDGQACVAQVSMREYVTHLRVKYGCLAVIHGDNELACLRADDFAPIDVVSTMVNNTDVRNAFCIASNIVYCDKDGNVFCEPIGDGDFQLQYSKEVRHNSKDRKVLCLDNKVVYCDKLSGDEFGLYVKQIGFPRHIELKRIKSSVYLSVVQYGDYILTASQQDQIGIWRNKKWDDAVRTIDTDSILRTIDVIKGHIAFVSGSHIFWLKIENWDKL